MLSMKNLQYHLEDGLFDDGGLHPCSKRKPIFDETNDGIEYYYIGFLVVGPHDIGLRKSNNIKLKLKKLIKYVVL